MEGNVAQTQVRNHQTEQTNTSNQIKTSQSNKILKLPLHERESKVI